MYGGLIVGINYVGIFFFVIPIIVSILVGSTTLALIGIKEIKRKFKKGE